MPSTPKRANNRSPSEKRVKRRKHRRDADADLPSEEDVISLDSEDLDHDTESDFAKPIGKRQRAKAKSKASPRKAASDDDQDDRTPIDLKDGQEVVGTVVQPPKDGHVPAGQISLNTLDFLKALQDPNCNDREWFKLHEPVYRLVEREWKDFIEVFTALLTNVDNQIPPLPPKDVIHRIYRDIRFSNDKTPYKTNLSASFSRSGRKGCFAHYHISIHPGNQSLIAGGAWCPGKNELATIRNNIKRNSASLRAVISAPEFVRHFGEAKPDSKGSRRNIFGLEDELKVAPKGIDKNHKDIDLLKCRSFAVVYKFSDEEVLSPDFKDELARMAGILRPFVHCLNDMMTLPNDEDVDSNGNGAEG